MEGAPEAGGKLVVGEVLQQFRLADKLYLSEGGEGGGGRGEGGGREGGEEKSGERWREG